MHFCPSQLLPATLMVVNLVDGLGPERSGEIKVFDKHRMHHLSNVDFPSKASLSIYLPEPPGSYTTRRMT